jgi:site-specific recombinase XerD
MKLTEAIELHIARKQSAGCRYRDASCTLRAFARSVGDLQLREVTPAGVKLFIDGGLSANVQRKRHCLLRLFYEYWVARGEVLSSPMPSAIPKVPKTFTPYIYSRVEIQQLLDATSLSQAKSWCAMSAQTFRTLLLFLYGTGLRLGEALRLEHRHVDPAGAIIRVEQTKFYKSRLVPMGADVSRLLVQHFAQQKPGDSACQNVFRTKSSEPIEMQTVDLSFRRLRRHAGITRHDFTTYQPRVHDLRHSFAVHRLVTWYQRGEDVQRLLPALSTYLGHVDLSGTQRYLSMTPELLQQASDRYERYALAGVPHGR